LMFDPSNLLVLGDGTNFPASSFATTIANGWVLVAVTKAAGTVIPRYHKYNYGTQVWDHANAGASVGNLPALTSYIVGLSGQGFQPWPGDVLIEGVWDSVLSDVTLETLPVRLLNWIAASPKEARRYDTAGTITPFVGTSSQTASVGGTLDAGDAPSGWDDSLAPIPYPIIPASMRVRKVV